MIKVDCRRWNIKKIKRTTRDGVSHECGGFWVRPIFEVAHEMNGSIEKIMLQLRNNEYDKD